MPLRAALSAYGVTRRMQELQELERHLKDLRQRCDEARDAAHCGILDGLSQAIVPGEKSASLVQGTHQHILAQDDRGKHG